MVFVIIFVVVDKVRINYLKINCQLKFTDLRASGFGYLRQMHQTTEKVKCEM